MRVGERDVDRVGAYGVPELPPVMRRREAGVNDLRIEASERRIFGPRPESEHGVEFPIQ